jgi:sporulation protein YlmC with PRC-barrel domain
LDGPHFIKTQGNDVVLRSINEIISYTIRASDGDIGRCQDFLFDERSWIVRYMVAKTAKWLPGRKVVIAPRFLDHPDWLGKKFPVELTREQIKEGPPLEEHAPISKQYDLLYHRHYSIPYWGVSPEIAAVVPSEPDLEYSKTREIKEEHDHLRSTEEICGYHIVGLDGEVGHVEDFFVDDDSWTIRYLVVDTRNWLPGRKVLVSPEWVESIDWPQRKVKVDLDIEAIKSSPELPQSEPVAREYENYLYNHYGRRRYWT